MPVVKIVAPPPQLAILRIALRGHRNRIQDKLNRKARNPYAPGAQYALEDLARVIADCNDMLEQIDRSVSLTDAMP